MKMKLVVPAVLFGFAASLQAGAPQIGLSIRTGGGWCPPVRPISSVRYCAPVAWRFYPPWYAFGPVAYYNDNWGISAGFSNVSPVMNYQNQTPIYRVPAPIITTQPLTVYPGSSFRWRH
jgi:hypothetical protein